jgi:hypothetical protein
VFDVERAGHENLRMGAGSGVRGGF